jgi:hypothetical protein
MQAKEETRLIEDNRSVLAQVKRLQGEKTLGMLGMFDLLCLSSQFQQNANKLMEM